MAPRTVWGCHSRACAICTIVAPSGRHSISMSRSHFVPGRGLRAWACRDFGFSSFAEALRFAGGHGDFLAISTKPSANDSDSLCLAEPSGGKAGHLLVLWGRSLLLATMAGSHGKGALSCSRKAIGIPNSVRGRLTSALPVPYCRAKGESRAKTSLIRRQKFPAYFLVGAVVASEEKPDFRRLSGILGDTKPHEGR
jgi:hypothetical protein